MLKGLANLCGCHFPSQSGGLGLKAEDGNTKKKKRKKEGEIRGNEKTKHRDKRCGLRTMGDWEESHLRGFHCRNSLWDRISFFFSKAGLQALLSKL